MNKSVVELVFPANSYIFIWEQHHKIAYYITLLFPGCTMMSRHKHAYIQQLDKYKHAHTAQTHTSGSYTIRHCLGMRVTMFTVKQNHGSNYKTWSQRVLLSIYSQSHLVAYSFLDCSFLVPSMHNFCLSITVISSTTRFVAVRTLHGSSTNYV